MSKEQLNEMKQFIRIAEGVCKDCGREGCTCGPDCKCKSTKNKSLQEGAWELPNNKSDFLKLAKLLKANVSNKRFQDKIDNILGDDSLFDDLDNLDPDGNNAAKVTIKWMQRQETDEYSNYPHIWDDFIRATGFAKQRKHNQEDVVRATKALLKVSKGLAREAKLEDADEFIKMYSDAADAYRYTAELISKRQYRKAAQVFDDIEDEDHDMLLGYGNVSGKEFASIRIVLGSFGSKRVFENETGKNCFGCNKEACQCKAIEEDAGHSITTIIGDDGLDQLALDLERTGDISPYSVYYEQLYDYYSKEMPHGIRTGDDGDPDRWIMDRIYQDYGDELDQESGDPYADEGWEDIELESVTESVLSGNLSVIPEAESDEEYYDNATKDMRRRAIFPEDEFEDDDDSTEDEELGLRFD